MTNQGHISRKDWKAADPHVLHIIRILETGLSEKYEEERKSTLTRDRILHGGIKK
jgi:hypothetical protein